MHHELQTPFTREILTEGASSLTYELFQGVGEIETGIKTGDHGHEFGVIGIVRTELNRRVATGKLKHSHIRVFHAHPEAIRARTRTAGEIDFNREFSVPGEMPVYPGAKLFRRATDQFPIKFLFSFHEDHGGKPGLPFYFYDIPQRDNEPGTEPLVQRLRTDLIGAIKHHGFGTHTGVDDTSDPVLRNWIENGYVQTVASDHYDTTSETHLVDLGARGLGTVERAFVFEIPGFESRAVKKAHVDLILDTFMLPFLQEALPIQ